MCPVIHTVTSSQVRKHLSAHCFKLCDNKMKESSLSKNPNFVWCTNVSWLLTLIWCSNVITSCTHLQIECRSGFIHEGKADDVACPHCHQSMCRKCKKKVNVATKRPRFKATLFKPCRGRFFWRLNNNYVEVQVYTFFYNHQILQWDPAHEGISCKAFFKCMIDDPDGLKVAAYVAANCIGTYAFH